MEASVCAGGGEFADVHVGGAIFRTCLSLPCFSFPFLEDHWRDWPMCTVADSGTDSIYSLPGWQPIPPTGERTAGSSRTMGREMFFVFFFVLQRTVSAGEEREYGNNEASRT